MAKKANGIFLEEDGLEPAGNAAVMRASAAAVLAVAISAISADCGGAAGIG